MPVYKYLCKSCGLEFDKLVSVSDAKKESDCISCSGKANKMITSANFNFKSKQEQGSTGIHDIDYPNVDKAVGRSAETKWIDFRDRREVADQARDAYNAKYLGKIAVDSHTDEYYKVSDSKVKYRREVANELSDALSHS
jgi:putative FmdB family regulatory protein